MTLLFAPLARRRQSGVTLTELMIALVLGALVVLAATAMVVTSRGTYRSQDEGTRLAESARFGLELGNRLVRLAGYTNFGDDSSPPASYYDVAYAAWKIAPDSYSITSPEIVGSNNSRPGGGAGVNGSDSLTIRYFGTSKDGTTTTANGGIPDGNVLDCAGTAVPQPFKPGPGLGSEESTVYAERRAYNVLFVDSDVDGEPALKCRRQTYDTLTGNPNGFDTQTLIRGVEDFQVLYGEALYPISPPNDPDSVAPLALVYRTGIGGSNPVVEWSNVRVVRIAMLLRSATGVRTEPESTGKTYTLFGNLYPAANDPGANFSLSSLSALERTRLRRVVETTVFVRNRVATWPSLQP